MHWICYILQNNSHLMHCTCYLIYQICNNYDGMITVEMSWVKIGAASFQMSLFTLSPSLPVCPSSQLSQLSGCSLFKSSQSDVFTKLCQTDATLLQCVHFLSPSQPVFPVGPSTEPIKSPAPDHIHPDVELCPSLPPPPPVSRLYRGTFT